MSAKSTLLAAALGSLLAASLAPASAAEADAERCYGVSKAGANDCGTAAHGCAGMAKTDNDPSEWKNVPKGTCEKLGGSLTDKAAKKPS